jgi:hypothetical protein
VRLAVAGQHREAAHLVARPLADRGAGEIANVVVVEHQQRAELGLLQRLARASEPIPMQAAEIDALLEVDVHHSRRAQRPRPVVARVDVRGADRLAFGYSGNHLGPRARRAGSAPRCKRLRGETYLTTPPGPLASTPAR